MAHEALPMDEGSARKLEFSAQPNVAIGTALVAGVKRSSGYIAVFGWWAVVVLVGAGIAAAFS